jgi:hypothetical protein
MPKYKLERTGQAPLSFEGALIAENEGKWAAGKEQNRWHDLRLYRTSGGKYVLQIEYCTQWQGELSYAQAEVVAAENVTDALHEYCPPEHLQGFPRMQQYADRQSNLLEWIRQRYEKQVSELLSKIDELSEKID